MHTHKPQSSLSRLLYIISAPAKKSSVRATREGRGIEMEQLTRTTPNERRPDKSESDYLGAKEFIYAEHALEQAYWGCCRAGGLSCLYGRSA
ncbi:hypothetical protein K504DRAFT_457903 [Pleomassaria siparia CBS 279.74]|uniref:Uncharacterized protein n=1 Tax=Pleomassaria siparia CBS 279.74 TaxID=1314801 RepID=A0A6G1KT90_9PLEO|nr:hypothetical protein K504DRAFT_457903 [Pleomassaria siparia CBS 279.74]